MQLENYIAGQWVKGTGKQSELIDAITGEGFTPSRPTLQHAIIIADLLNGKGAATSADSR